MARLRRVFTLIGCLGLGSAALADSGQVTVAPMVLPPLPLGMVSLGGGRAVNLTVSAGSGAYRGPGEATGRLWTITDRGPAIDCNEEREIIGPDDKQICAAGRRGKIYLLPTFAPSIYGVEVGTGKHARISTVIPLKGASGRPLSGLPNPLQAARPEVAYGPDGQELPPDPSGIAPGGLVRLSDGTFFVADSAGPSLLEVAVDGAVRRRIVPQSLGEDLRDADYPIEPSLPGILALRAVGRGFEGVAVSPDETRLFVAMQSALMNPALEDYRASPLVRLYALDRQTGQLADRFVYRLDTPEMFQGDSGITARPPRQSDVRLMEIAALGSDSLLVLERFRNLSRIYRVRLSGAVSMPKMLDDPAAQPTLEQRTTAQLAEAGVVPLEKTLVFQSDATRGPAGRLAGMAVLSDRELLVIGNNDFGIDGSRTQMFRLTFPASILN